MRRLILQEFVTVNGLAAGPGDSTDFVSASVAGDESFGRRQLAFIDSVDTMLLGRVTYQLFSQYWPNVTGGEDAPFAEKLNRLEKVVFSRTLVRAPWGAFPEGSIVNDQVAETVASLKQGAGKDMVVWGSLTLARLLAREDLIDEYQLFVCPIVLESGKPLFGEKPSERLNFALSETHAFDRGAVLLSYLPVHEP